MSSIRFVSNSRATAISNIFIDEYMGKATSPVFSLIYIYAFRCAIAGISITNEDIGKRFNIIESDVIKAWKYWKSVGLVEISGSKEEPIIEFVAMENKSPAVEEVAVSEEKPQNKNEKAKIVTVRKVYEPSDINMIIKDNPEVGELLKIGEGSKGKLLSQRETELIVWMYNELELPFDTVLVLLNFCYQNNKPIKYMEKTAIDWNEKGIVTSEAASDYLSFYSNYGRVLKCFGVMDRAATAPERNHIDRWIKEWNMSFELIELAIKRTVENTGKAAFSYCNKIIESWYKSNFKTVADVERSEAEYINSKGNKKTTVKQQQPKGVFNNYNQKIYSADEIEEILKRKGNA